MANLNSGQPKRLRLFDTLPVDRSSRSLKRIDGMARHGGYAHLPGGGPTGTRCGSCGNLGMTAHQAKQFPICRFAYQQLIQCRFSEDRIKAKAQARSLERRLGGIEPGTPSCKFFDVCK